MDIFRFFAKKNVLLRCTACLYEYEISPREVRLLCKENASDPTCPIKEECHLCHIGFMIPVKYTDKNGNQYLYHEIKPKIKNLDPSTLMERIFGDDHEGFVMYIPPNAEL
jgi:hypothetical protein